MYGACNVAIRFDIHLFVCVFMVQCHCVCSNTILIKDSKYLTKCKWALQVQCLSIVLLVHVHSSRVVNKLHLRKLTISTYLDHFVTLGQDFF